MTEWSLHDVGIWQVVTVVGGRGLRRPSIAIGPVPQGEHGMEERVKNAQRRSIGHYQKRAEGDLAYHHRTALMRGPDVATRIMMSDQSHKVPNMDSGTFQETLSQFKQARADDIQGGVRFATRTASSPSIESPRQQVRAAT